MSVTFSQNEGSRTTTRAITGIAAGVVTVATALTTAAVGDVCEILSSSTTANNSVSYTLVAITGAGPFNYTLRPAPVNQGASGSLVRLNRTTARTLSATAVTSIVNLPGLSVIQVAGANFLTNGIQPMDRLALSGNATAANNGAWPIIHILDEDNVVVAAPDGGTGMTAEAVGTGNIGVRHGIYTFSVVSEAALSWQRLLDVGVPQNGPTGGAPYFGPALVRYLIRKEAVGGVGLVPENTRTLFRLCGVATVLIDQSGLGTPSAWDSLNEIVVANRDVSPGSGGSILTARLTSSGTWGAGNELDITLGAQVGDRFSAQDGSVWIGLFWAGPNFTGTQRFRLNVFGSLVDHVFPNVIAGPNGAISASIIRPSLTANSGLLESTVLYGGAGIVGQAAGDQANLLMSQQTASNSIGDAGVVIEGLLLSDQVLTPAFNNISNGLLTFLDPRQDFDISIVAANFIGASSVVQKLYTFNPTFAQFVAPFAPPLPASGLTVRIHEINETTSAVTTVFSGTTDAQGKLNGGVGLELRRQTMPSTNVPVAFSHHIEVEGPGYRRVAQIFQMRAPALNAITIPRIAADYEGELSR